MRERIESFGCLFIVDPADRGTLKRFVFPPSIGCFLVKKEGRR